MLSGLGAAFHSTAVANAGNHLTSNIAIAWLSVAVMLIVAARRCHRNPRPAA